MAKPKQIPYARAVEAMNATKLWPADFEISWITNCAKGFPKGWEFRVPLALENGVIQAGLFIKAYYKQEMRPELRDKLSFTLFVDSCRVVGLDENGLGSHTNKGGKGLPYYQKVVGYPHLHLPTRDNSSDYAEPIEKGGAQYYWELFLRHSNIMGAPEFRLPENTQIELL